MPSNAAILLSQQHLYPCGGDPWVANTMRALHLVRQLRWSIVSSVGMPTWDFITCCAADLNIPLRIVVDDPALDPDAIRTRYELPASTPITLPGNISQDLDRAERAALRDEMILSLVETLIPVSIRPGGKLDALLTKYRGSRAQVMSHFAAPYDRRAETAGYTLSTDDLSGDVLNLSHNYVCHWTRATNGPWPDESIRSYNRAVAKADAYPRTAFHTLQRIIKQGRLLASERHMPKQVAAVSFSALSVVEMIPLMRWRARYRQMSFEPYGIGIRMERAEQIGIEPVQYVEDPESLSIGNERWKYQSAGRHTDWRTEREYRHRGDVRISGLRPDDVLVFCKTKEESEVLCSQCDFRVIALLRD